VRHAALIGLLLAGCATTNAAHRNFTEVMDRQVGKGIDDPDAYPVFYRLREGKSKQLENGNRLYEYLAGRNERCLVQFEVDPATRRILRWSSEGRERDCVIPPRSP
jgi:hypothetical protein